VRHSRAADVVAARAPDLPRLCLPLECGRILQFRFIPGACSGRLVDVNGSGAKLSDLRRWIRPAAAASHGQRASRLQVSNATTPDRCKKRFYLDEVVSSMRWGHAPRAVRAAGNMPIFSVMMNR
jgi:hypothetical protein